MVIYKPVGPHAKYVAQYKERKRAGLPVGPVPPAFRPLVLDPLDDADRAEMAVLSHDAVRGVLGGWLLNQRSDNTRVTYRRAWQAWVEWCDLVGADWLEPTRQQGGAWVASMRADGLSAATVRVRVVGVRGALLELSLEGLRAGPDPFLSTKLPKVADTSSTVPLSDDVVLGALAAATGLGGEYRTLVLLLAVCGLRADEVAQVSAGTVKPSPWGPVAQIVRKGGREALVPLPAAVVEAAAINGWPCEGRKHMQRRRDRVTYMLGRVSSVLGAPLHPHQFRHWHATVALREGVALERVQDSLGHADPATTQRYNRARNIVVNHSAFTVAGLLESE